MLAPLLVFDCVSSVNVCSVERYLSSIRCGSVKQTLTVTWRRLDLVATRRDRAVTAIIQLDVQKC